MPQSDEFGSGSYYGVAPDWSPRPREKRWHEQMLERMLGEDVRKECQQTVKRMNLSLRDAIRSATALRLIEGGERVAVPVAVVPGLPAPLTEVLESVPDETLWWLAVHRPMLERARDGVKLIGDHRELLAGVIRQLGLSDEDIDRATRLTDGLLARAQYDELRDKLASISVDVLGAYWFGMSKIEIYWLVVGLYARFLGVSVAALCTVVLCHELAHAYTHLGRDTDRRQWATRDFAKSDKHIVEGLAQFYTAMICKELADREPEVAHGFHQLLTVQGAPYTDFLNWFGSQHVRNAEAVRAAMIEYRAGPPRPYAGFREMLGREAQRIGAAASPQARLL